ncbi:50S ribosomal protein L25 [Cohnella zeiphila]|uniref:Large ribosomal subunit protein bL25 n=1 Tax=Cohnella zeiphila TaxID=2761120 RepID=A0A7X0SNZ0_9BACL|nr:50S ribosomal protein L25 [Cohnella zeiphila]MBB6733384.1 50S ribosomal protein L25 [Cohnella zeiphila]
MSVTLHAEPRILSTKGDLRRLRQAGKVPGVVYGKQQSAAAAISIEAKELQSLMRGNPHSILELMLPDNGQRSVLLSDIQRDAISGQVLHVDFHQIDLNETVRSAIPLIVNGVSPGEKEGGMLQHVLHELEVECVAKDLPSSIEVDVGSLSIGDHVTVAELKLPSGVKALGDPELVVLSVLAPQKDRTEDELEAMDDAAEQNEQQSREAQAVETDR